MRVVWALAWKEWRIMLDTPLGYVVTTAFLLVSGFFFGKNLFLFGQAEMRGYFELLPLLLLFFAPAMAMRMLAEERHDGSDELLATLPTRNWEIMLGKYVALLGQMLLLLLATCLYPLSLSLLGTIDVGQIAASYLAALLLAACYLAIGLYASSLTKRTIVAYVLGLGMLLGMYLLDAALSTLPPEWQDVVALLSPIMHYRYMLRGVVGLEHVVLLLAWTWVFLSLSWFQWERRAWQ